MKFNDICAARGAAADEHDAQGEVFSLINWVFELANADWSCSRIAAELNRMGFQSELGAGWSVSNLRQALDQLVDTQESTQ